ncbi:MAG TPA: cupredoxin family copper-binding protein [Thermomicrobiales bacterium]|nr:cupredoxin family copper-binding protein [Thermomicrobiales bacterium]
MTQTEIIRNGAMDAPQSGGAPRISRRALAIALSVAGGAVALDGLGRAASGAGLNLSGAPSPAPCAASTPAAGASVTIANFAFDPAEITVPVGTTVTWTNQDDVPHTVTSDDKKTFGSAGLDTGDTFQFRFTKPGTYGYFCSIHPMMTAKVIVK